MNVKEALTETLKDYAGHKGGHFHPPAFAAFLAPEVEAALQEVADAVEDVYKEIYHEGSALDEGIKQACVTAGIVKLIKKRMDKENV